MPAAHGLLSSGRLVQLDGSRCCHHRRRAVKEVHIHGQRRAGAGRRQGRPRDRRGNRSRSAVGCSRRGEGVRVVKKRGRGCGAVRTRSRPPDSAWLIVKA